jgi:UDP-glucuronate 4-epimerase
MQTALITGSAGFIGFHVATRLLAAGWRVVGLDSFSDYYDVGLKRRRHAMLEASPEFIAVEGRLEAPGLLRDLFETHRPDRVVHLAAQAGVRHSIDAPRSYVEANLIGTFELLEAARAFPPGHLMLASTSSAYGAGTEFPYTELQKTDHQVSFYAATKKATESMAHSYAHLYGLPVTMFRFFTVYGPWGRPDMAYFKFTRAILEGRPIEVYNHGQMRRDFTYIDDLVESLIRLSDVPPGDAPVGPMDSLSPVAPWRVVNIGNGKPVVLGDFIAAIETALGQTAEKIMLPMQPGDVPATWASAELLDALVGTRQITPLATGMAAFAAWYRDYYGV